MYLDCFRSVVRRQPDLRRFDMETLIFGIFGVLIIAGAVRMMVSMR